MEKIGEQKTRLSERLQQRQEQELAEVATLTKANLNKLSADLTQHVSDALNTTNNAITQQNEQITRLLGAQQHALKQQQATVEALKRLSVADLAAIHESLLDDLNKVKERAIWGSIEPLRQVMARLEEQGEALNRLTLRAWVKPLLLSVAIGLGVMVSVMAGVRWLENEVSRQQQILADLQHEIGAAEATLERLPRGVRFVKDGKRHFIIAKKMTDPFTMDTGEYKGKMIVGVN